MAKPPVFRHPGNREFNACYRKRKFKSEEQAQKANLGQRPYRCPHCGDWHLASRKTNA